MKTTPVEKHLDDIQANILKPHGRNYTRCLFLRFSGNPERIRYWISNSIAPEVTTTAKQIEDSGIRKEDPNHDGGLVTCFFLSFGGLQKLDIPSDQLPEDASFRLGMKSGIIRGRLHDTHHQNWETFFQEDVDAMVLLASDDDSELQNREGELSRECRQLGIGYVLATQKGKRLRFGGYDVEPFGFRDGVSQPQFWVKDKDGKERLSEKNLRLVLDDQLGSYLVFRKLEQDVLGFYEKVLDLSRRLKVSRQFAEAMIVGRFKDGTPLVFFQNPGKKNSEEEGRINKFNHYDSGDPKKIGYEEDSLGLKCPFHAHIRKANPRNSEMVIRPYPDRKKAYEARIVRRGVPYDGSGKEEGLLFMCYQASIRFQYEIIQSRWSNNKDFPKKNITGIDPIGGQIKAGDQNAQQWNSAWNDPNSSKASCDFSEVVRLQGGEYFYAPPLPFLHSLSSDTERSLSSTQGSRPYRNISASNRAYSIGGRGTFNPYLRISRRPGY
jgi:Dyp-type peroxidase family